MNPTLVNAIFMIAAFILAIFAMTMFVKYESNDSIKTVIYDVPDCRNDVNTVCQRVAGQSPSAWITED